MLLAVHYRVMEHLGSLESTQEAWVALGYRLGQLLRFFRALQTSRVLHLALINRAGGLYGRILTEVVSTDRTQWGLYKRPRSRFSHTDRLSSVKKMFIIWQKQEQFNSFQVTGLY